MTSAQRQLRITGSHRAVTGHGAAEGERPLTILMLLGGLGVGGAEHQAIALAGSLQRRGHAVHIVALADGPLRQIVEAEGLSLDVLVRPLAFSPAAIPALARVIRRTAPDVLYAFLDVQWLMALAARTLAPRVRVVLGLRSSQYFQQVDGARDRAVRQLTRRFARFADLLIANSLAGLNDFNRLASRAPYGMVVPNGIDPARFSPDPVGRRVIRASWSVSPSDIVIGHVGRLDPVKHHELLLDAFARLAGNDPRVKLVCVGEGSAARLEVLRDAATRHGIADRVSFIGGRSDLSAVYSAFDVLALSSAREGFPNVVAEAMLCGVPAVVTDTGASAEIVGSLGDVSPCGDAASFAAGLARVIARRSPALSARCRLRILADFTLDRSAALTCAAFQSLIPHSGDRQ
ncbi:MAG: glycosyltransferase [Gemmatimonadaceae bacterium]|nr:glycosyltransferase [Gemmatimonadaceae bacterium]